MDTPLLATKLFVPQAMPGLVLRPRLVERLNDAIGHSLVIVSAPAGFGKTTVLTQWIAENKSPIPVAWIQLDEGDNDAVRFWDYFIAALKTFKPAAGDAASSVLHSGQSYTIEAVLTSLINDIAGIPQSFAVVLDDYHLIKSDPLHTGMAFLLDHLPPNLHLIVATRVDPPFSLPRFRGRGALVEIGADDLRFTPDEAARLLNATLGVPLSAEDVYTLNSHTEGWAVGLKMAALSIRGRKDVAGFIASFTGSQRYVMDYLMEEVLKRQRVAVRDFLLKTSVLERLTEPLCDFLTGDSPDHDMLAELEHANLFLVPLDDARRWYRYHHLFAELLRHQMETNYGPKEATRLHRLASQWYEENRLPDDAIHHALVARDWEGAMRSLNGVADRRIKRGENATLLNWLQVVPDEVLRTDLCLYRQYARALVQTGQLDAAESVLGFLETAARGEISMQGEVAALQADLVIRKGDIPRTIELADKALSLLPEEDFAYRCRASHILGLIAHDRGLYDEAWSRMTDAYEAGRQAGDFLFALEAYSYLGGIQLLQGSLSRAEELSQRAIELAGQSPAAGPGRFFLGSVHYELNRLEESTYNLQLAADLLGIRGTPDNIANSNIVLANARLAGGDMAGCLKAMDIASQAANRGTMRPATRARQAAWRILLAIRQDDLTTASYWANRLSEHSDTLSFQFRHFPLRLLIAQGEKESAARQLQKAREQAARVGAKALVIEILVYQSLAAATPSEALSFLTEALEMGQPEGFIRTFVDEGKLLKPLLCKALSDGTAPEYTARLVGIIETEERFKRAAAGQRAPVRGSTEFLSQREIEVLRLVAEGLSNQQIAERLTVSLSTTKTHVHRLFEKLNAGNRFQAVTRAKEMKLI